VGLFQPVAVHAALARSVKSGTAFLVMNGAENARTAQRRPGTECRARPDLPVRRTRGDRINRGRKKKGRRAESSSAVHVRRSFLPHDLGHGRLTELAVRAPYGWRTESRSAGLFQPVAIRTGPGRSASSGTAFLVMDDVENARTAQRRPGTECRARPDLPRRDARGMRITSTTRRSTAAFAPATSGPKGREVTVHRQSVRVGADPDLEAVEPGDAAEARADVHDLDGLQHVGELHRGRRQLF
jgi:hypothetical protein